MRTLLLAVLLLTGCDKPPHQLEWVLTADVALLAQVTSIESEIRAGGCDGEAVYRAQFTLGTVADAPIPDRLSPGVYGFHARAQDATCHFIAEGCTPLTLPANGEVVVELRRSGPSVGSPVCEAAACRAGTCVEPTPDAGVDADTDAGTTCEDGTNPPCELCVGDSFAFGRIDLPSSDQANNPSASFGDDGRVHVAYRMSTNALSYASRPVTGIFRARLVDDQDNPGAHLAMAAHEGAQHLVYAVRDGGRRLKHAYRSGAGEAWTVSEIVETGSDPRGADIVAGPAGVVAVWSQDDRLHIAERADSGAWGILGEAPLPEIDGQTPRPGLVDAALADDGTLHVVFRNEDGGRASYARRAVDGTWTAEHLRDGSGDAGASVAWSASAGLRIAYADVSSDLVVAEAAPGETTLVRREPPEDEDIHRQIGIAIDEVGRTHLAYAAGWEGPLVYRTLGDTGLSTAEQVADEQVGDHVQVVVADQIPTIIYSDDGQQSLRMATKIGPAAFAVSIVDDGRDTASHHGAVIDEEGRLIVAVHDEQEDLVRSVCRSTEGDWTAEAVPDAGTYERVSMARTADGDVFIAYEDSSTRGLMAAHREPAGGWTLEVVDGTVSDIQALALERSPEGEPHVAYVSNRRLLYAARSSDGRWSTRMLLDVGDVRNAMDMAMGPDGATHIVYATRSGDRELVHVRYDGTGAARLGVIDPEGAHEGLDLIATEAGLLQLAYHRGRDVFHATGTLEGSWIPRSVTAAESSAVGLSIALDPRGGIGIAFTSARDWTNESRMTSGTDYRTNFVYASPGADFSPRVVVQPFAQNGWSGTALVYLPDGSPLMLYASDEGSRQLRSTVGPPGW